MRLEDMKDTFPKMPEDIKNMIEKEVTVQIKSRQEESLNQENDRQSEKTKDKENAKVIKYRKKKNRWLSVQAQHRWRQYKTCQERRAMQHQY